MISQVVKACIITWLSIVTIPTHCFFKICFFAYVVRLRWEANVGSGGTNYSIQYRLENVNSDPAFNTSFTTAATVSPSTLSVYIFYSFVYSRLQV